MASDAGLHTEGKEEVEGWREDGGGVRKDGGREEIYGGGTGRGKQVMYTDTYITLHSRQGSMEKRRGMIEG